MEHASLLRRLPAATAHESGRVGGLGFRATPATFGAGLEALSCIWFPWREQLPRWSLRFLGERPGFLGRTLWPDRVIEVYVQPGQAVHEVAFALAHELGHATDLEHFDPDTRRRWRRARGLPAALDWFGPSDADDFATPAGDWAECFAAWQVGARLFQSQLGPAPSEGQLDVVAALALGAPRPGGTDGARSHSAGASAAMGYRSQPGWPMHQAR